MKKQIAIIVAFAKNNVIGNKGRIPWDFPRDRLYFKTLTTGNSVIFGRKTFEEFNRPLPNRKNIVVSSKKIDIEGIITAKNLNEAIQLADEAKTVFLCGGHQIYKEGLELADLIYTTQIDMNIEGDVFFPQINMKEFEIFEKTEEIENGIKLNFITYRRIKKNNQSE